MKKVEIKVVGISRLVCCVMSGIRGAGYKIASDCKKCRYFEGLECIRNEYGLIVEGYVLCRYERKRGKKK